MSDDIKEHMTIKLEGLSAAELVAAGAGATRDLILRHLYRLQDLVDDVDLQDLIAYVTHADLTVSESSDD